MSFRPLPAPETGLSEGGAAPTARLKAAPHLSSLGSNGASKHVHFFFPKKSCFFFGAKKLMKGSNWRVDLRLYSMGFGDRGRFL